MRLDFVKYITVVYALREIHPCMTISAGTFDKVTDFKIELVSNDRHLSSSFLQLNILNMRTDGN
jgi:hypothetical protein